MNPFHSRKEGGDGEGDGDGDVRRGPWTLEEDTMLIRYISCHGEGRWNLLAKGAGLKRTGKSCRLRWLNYLKPDIKRGNLTPQEQLLILELHSKWGNRWSKIAQHLPGRTDNEIKNYWRTRVQKQAKQLNMESNSQSFIDAIRCFYMPRLVEKTEQVLPAPSITTMDPMHTSSSSQINTSVTVSPASPPTIAGEHNYVVYDHLKGYSSSSCELVSSFEPENLMNPLLPELNNIDRPFTFGPIAQEQYPEIEEDNSVFFSDGNYMDDSNSCGVDNMASSMSEFSESNIADHGWLVDGMLYDPWNIDRLW